MAKLRRFFTTQPTPPAFISPSGKRLTSDKLRICPFGQGFANLAPRSGEGFIRNRRLSLGNVCN